MKCKNCGHFGCSGVCEQFELIVPEKVFIINSLTEARKIIERYNLHGITIRRIKLK